MYPEYYFQDRANRDAKAKQLRAQGDRVFLTTAHRCVLSPSAVLDYIGPTSPNGFGGPADKWWSKLYVISYDS